MWQKKEKDSLIYFTLPQWQKLGAEVYISCRPGGVSSGDFASLNLALHVSDSSEAVKTNRRRFFQAIGVDSSDFVALQQTHSKNARRVTAADRGKGLDSYDTALADTDAAYTTDAGVLLATFYADCLPIALFDQKNQALALVHAGWRGTYQNIGAEVLAKMARDYNTKPQDVLVAFGPGIGQCCYEVDEQFYQRFLKAYDQAAHWFKPGKPGKWFFDNAGANQALLMQAGIKECKITDFPLCTACNQELFYSYRASAGRCGRHGLFGRLCKEDM